jgi:GAF domain-containing protein
MDAERELEDARRRIAELEAAVAVLRAQVEGDRVATELRARLAEVGAVRTLAAPPEHAELLEQIVRTAMHVLNASAGSLYLLDEERDELVFEVALGERAATLRGRRVPVGRGVAGWVAATGQALAIADVASDARWAEEIGRAVDYLPRTMLAVPLLLHDEVLGILQLLDKDGGQPFPAADLTTLGLFGQQAAVAIDQSRTVRNLALLMRGLLADLEAPGDLAERARDLVARVEASADYRRTLDLAALVGTIARSGAGGRDLAIEILGAIVKHQQGQPGSQW